MDAIDFVKSYSQMCKMIGDCEQCPCYDMSFCAPKSQEEAEEIVRRVEEWAATHPIRTLQDVFLEQWPEAYVEDDGCLLVCPKVISAKHRNEADVCLVKDYRCAECRHEFWGQEVED